MVRIICLAMGYVFGLFQTAFFIGKMHGMDIREHGSGNAGTTNALRVLGTKVGLLVFLGDALKSIFAVILTRVLFGGQYPDIILLLCLYSGAGVIIGHNFPFYMNFKGGKGIAATAGWVIAFNPWFTLVGVTCFFGLFFLTHLVSLCSLLTYTVLMIMMIIFGQFGLSAFAGMSQGNLIEMYIVFGLLLLLAFWRHRENVKRLLSGTERKTYLTKKNKE